ncbi:carboxymuconolactone decarboxylase family protein [Rhodococcus sp. IEGM 1366]|uniref:carboxymuconolactone decarboxylase family protein n=1 Tax=Rhodococcus sp. IEGM 1366 TaxID=3082223 RepID=UPI002952D223|nr:carboxymuconolactone decarboxylase family protein [Rhodococcus sp. IEGM 1366]MDV8070571.1 carboxymuconolactone decarboxylase family protein [Rhodococcus sp. IEGM 1366]
MPRVEPAAREGAIADRLRTRRGGHLTPLDDALLHSEPFADGWNSLLAAVRSQMNLPGDLRELAISRVADLNDADYVWHAHVPLALNEGLTVEQVAALREGADTAPLTELQLLVRTYTDAMTRTISVSDELSDRIHALLGTEQFVELTGTIAAYNMVSRFLVALDIGQIQETEGSEITA